MNSYNFYVLTITLITSATILVSCKSSEVSNDNTSIAHEDIVLSENINWLDSINSDLQTQYSDSLLKIGKKLTGTWKLVGTYKNDIFITDTLKVWSDTLAKIQTDSGIYIIDKFKNYEKVDIGYAMMFNFSHSKYGDYQTYYEYDYSQKRNIGYDHDSQPVPTLVYHNGKIKLHFTLLTANHLQEFYIKDTTLIYYLDESKYVLYEKIK